MQTLIDIFGRDVFYHHILDYIIFNDKQQHKRMMVPVLKQLIDKTIFIRNELLRYCSSIVLHGDPIRSLYSKDKREGTTSRFIREDSDRFTHLMIFAERDTSPINLVYDATNVYCCISARSGYLELSPNRIYKKMYHPALKKININVEIRQLMELARHDNTAILYVHRVCKHILYRMGGSVVPQMMLQMVLNNHKLQLSKK